MSTENPTSLPFPLRLTGRGECLSPAQLQVVMNHPVFHRLVRLQEAVYDAAKAERQAEQAAHSARVAAGARNIVAWKLSDYTPDPLRTAYEQARDARIDELAEVERLRDEIALAHIGGTSDPSVGASLKAQLEAAMTAHQGAILVERAARAAFNGIKTPPVTEVERPHVEELVKARVRTLAAVGAYKQAAEHGVLSRFVSEEPRLKRPESDSTRKENDK